MLPSVHNRDALRQALETRIPCPGRATEQVAIWGGEDTPKVVFAQNNNVVQTVERCQSYIPRGPARFRRLLTFDQ
jgi:hypothetical protein